MVAVVLTEESEAGMAEVVVELLAMAGPGILKPAVLVELLAVTVADKPIREFSIT